MMHGRITRRGWLKTTAVVGALGAVGTGGYALSQRRIRLGLIGAGGRGTQLANVLRWTRARPLYGDVLAVCDVHAARARQLRDAYFPQAELVASYAKLLERDDLDAVVIATPDHWHTAMSLAALDAGKAVYCEKPLTLTVAEGQQLVRAVQQRPQVFQVGTQQRSGWMFQTACALVRNGRLGPLQRIKVSLPNASLPPGSFAGPFTHEPPPAELDWNAWLGQAPWVEFCKQRYNPFRWWFEYSGGFMTDWGAHHIDIAQWAMGLEHGGPTQIEAQAELPNIPNGYNTPQDLQVRLSYENGVTMDVVLDSKVSGIEFVGEQGSIFVNRRRVTGEPLERLAHDPLPANATRLANGVRPWGTMNDIHMLEFLHCVETGAQPISDVASQHRSATVCHLANIAIRLGRKLTWDPQQEHFVNDIEANGMLSRPQRDEFRFLSS